MSSPDTSGRFRLLLPLVTAACLGPLSAHAFCGFYVGKSDTKLFNEASQVALVRDGERTVMAMSNDYKSPLSDFALVVPVPSVLSKEQIHVGELKYVARLDTYLDARLNTYSAPDHWLCAR